MNQIPLLNFRQRLMMNRLYGQKHHTSENKATKFPRRVKNTGLQIISFVILCIFISI